jgi:phosphoribosyl 1,2-cyclic phosphodiesterase
MRLHFWGVCGSLPSPQTPSRIKSKISAIIEQITTEDIQSPETRERFLAGLPPWLFGTVGGNSPCVSVFFDDPKECIIFDCGSGLREMGTAMADENPRPSRYHVFFSHFHWDHLQGLPFFSPCYDPSIKVDFYSPVPGLEKILAGQMVPPYFPVSMESMAARKSFHLFEKPVQIGNCSINYKKMKHPGDSYAYCVNENGKRFIYATDTELAAADFLKTEENSAFFRKADLLVIDCQYTLGEAIEKYNWGHSAFNLAVNFAVNWEIKRMVMYHHEPAHSDSKLYSILQSARRHLEDMKNKGIEVILATEGLEIDI